MSKVCFVLFVCFGGEWGSGISIGSGDGGFGSGMILGTLIRAAMVVEVNGWWLW